MMPQIVRSPWKPTTQLIQLHKGTQPRVVGEQKRGEEGGEEGEVKIPFGAQ